MMINNHTATYILNLGKTWEKLILAARVIVAIENPKVSLMPTHGYDVSIDYNVASQRQSANDVFLLVL